MVYRICISRLMHKYAKNFNILKVVFLSVAIFNLMLAYSFSEEVPESCREEVLHATLTTISFPRGVYMKEFKLSPDNKKILCLLVVWQKNLLRCSNSCVLKEAFPGDKEKEISFSDSETVILEWKNLTGKEEGVKFEIAGQTTLIEKQEFQIYDIQKSVWSKLSWKTGGDLFSEWQKGRKIFSTSYRRENLVLYDNAVWIRQKGSDKPISRLTDKFVYLGNDFIESPDGSKIIYKPYLKRKPISLIPFGPPMGYEHIYGLGICCINEKINKIFNLGRMSVSLDGDTHMPVFNPQQWASDGSFLLIFGGAGNVESFKLLLLRFKKI